MLAVSADAIAMQVILNFPHTGLGQQFSVINIVGCALHFRDQLDFVFRITGFGEIKNLPIEEGIIQMSFVRPFLQWCYKYSGNFLEECLEQESACY
jgi:hypothetical protein